MDLWHCLSTILPCIYFSNVEISPVCKLHDGRLIEYYCEDDGVPICSRCVIMGDHKGHNIASMEEKVTVIKGLID